MARQIPEENQGLWFNTFTHLINGGCPEDQARECADIVATDKPGLPNLGRSQADTALVKDSVKYLIKGADYE